MSAMASVFEAIVFFKNGPFPASFCYFCLFKQTLQFFSKYM